MSRNTLTALVFALAVIIPTVSLAFLGWSNIETDGQGRMQRLRARQSSAAEGAIEFVQAELQRFEVSERQKPHEDYFQLLAAGASFSRFDVGRFRVERGAQVRFPDQVIVPELQVEYEPLLAEASRRAAELEAAAGDLLRAELEDMIAASLPGEVRLLPVVMAGGTRLAALRLVQTEKQEPCLVGSFLDLGRLWDEANAIQRLESGRLELTTPTSSDLRLDQSDRLVLDRTLDVRRLPGWIVWVVEQAPNQVEIAVAKARRSFALFMSMLGLAVVGCLIATWRLLKGGMEIAREREHFVSAVTHELRTPLTAIKMFAELLADGEAGRSPQNRRSIDHILAEAARLERLVENVLVMTSSRRGRAPLVLRRDDLRAALTGVVAGRANALARAGFVIELDLDDEGDDTLEVAFDELALERIVGNLIDNAIKYGAGEDKRVIVRIDSKSDPIRLVVADRGRGIPAGEEERIFERFHRAEAGRSGRAGGVGLGLAIVRELASAMGWSVRARNAESGGAEFTLSIPRA